MMAGYGCKINGCRSCYKPTIASVREREREAEMRVERERKMRVETDGWLGLG
jgi:hypothetical protein